MRGTLVGTINWVNLWVLNRLVRQEETVSNLVLRPESEGGSYWSFPARDALRAAPKTRLEAIAVCVEMGWIAAYPTSWSTNSLFTPCPVLSARELRQADESSTCQLEMTLTEEGHLTWTEQFDPDWGRFWEHLGTEDDSDGGDEKLTVLYSSNEILEDLVQWMPEYWDLDKRDGLKLSRPNTVFRYRAAKWVQLPEVKICTFSGRKDMRHTTVKDRQGYEEYIRSIREAKNSAVKTLHRLSRRWECDKILSPLCRDGVPRQILPAQN